MEFVGLFYCISERFYFVTNNFRIFRKLSSRSVERYTQKIKNCMKKILKIIYQSIPEFGRYIIAAATIFVISLLFPKHQQFSYAFEIGQQWKNQDLYAPFDFAILKQQDEITQQLDSLKATLVPCYEKDGSIVINKIELLTKRFNDKLETVTTDDAYEDVTINAQEYLKTCKTLLKSIYDKGVIDNNQDFGGKITEHEILIAEGKKRIQSTSKEFENVETAQRHFRHNLMQSGLKDSDFFLSILQEEPSLITPNIIFNDSLTFQFHEAALLNFSTGRGMVKEGERIILRREIISESAYQKLLSLKDAYNKKQLEDGNIIWTRIGYFILTSLVVLLFIFFLKRHTLSVFNSYKQLYFMMMWVLVFSYLVYWVENMDLVSLYSVPFCIVPIVIKNFYDDITAFFTHIVVILMASLLSSLGFEFIFTQILVGAIVVIANVKTRYWSSFFFSMAYLLGTYIVVFVGLSMLQQGTWDLDNGEVIGWLFANVFLTLLSYPLVPLLERLFGYTSDITLDELSNLDQPLLKELSLKAPGTLQHSLQVGHLSEAAASAIGANALLVKVAALYHDIGKVKNPMFFIENQQGQASPHNNLSPLESATVIIEHVTEGLRLAKKHGLPKVVTEFIATHHGTTRTEFFYRKFLQDNPEVFIDETAFCYPGPIPTTKEHVVMMLADSIEAASKSLVNPTEESINQLVEKITAGKIENRQLIHSDLTFEELEKVKIVFKRVLKSIYHARIAYPKEGK